MGSNELKGYDGMQVLRSVFEIEKNCLRVCIVDGGAGEGSALEVIIDHTTDSVQIGDGSNLVTTTNLAGKVSLDVNVANIGESVTNDGEGNPITSTSDIKTGLDVVQINKLIKVEHDEIDVTYNADKCPTLVEYKSVGTTVAALTITYDADGDILKIRRT